MDVNYWLISIVLIQFSSAASIDGVKSYNNYKYYELRGSKDGVNNLIQFFKENYDIPEYSTKGDNIGYIMVAPDVAPVLENAALLEGLKTQILVNDVSELFQKEKAHLSRGLGFSWTSYYDIDDINSYLHNMSKSYPDVAEVIVGGKSFEGRQLLGLKINTRSDRKKPIMFIESGIHAREWIAPATTTYFINELLTSKDKDISRLKDEYEWQIFPCINPDGYHYSFTTDRMWRKTRSKHPTSNCFGADPNRNWKYNWGKHGTSDNPCDMTYGGTKPFSEVETKSLSEYIQSLDNLEGYIAFHSCAQMLLLPYSDSSEHFDNYDELKRIGQISLDYGYKVNNISYDGLGTAAEILYKASGCSMDWVRFDRKTRLVFTYELRGNFFHWPPARIAEQGDEVTQMLLGLVTAARKTNLYKDSIVNK